MDRQKRIERQYVDEARRASQIFPVGELVSHESPDFLLSLDDGTLGIEVTELCRERPRTEGATLSKVPRNAKAMYNSMAGSEPLDVTLTFSPQASDIHPNLLAQSLADFVYSRRDSRGICASGDLPVGYGYLAIHTPQIHTDKTGHWYGVRAFDVEIASKKIIEDRIADKNNRFAKYRESATVVWLLIVNDQFLGAGEVYVRPEDLAVWEFRFEFEKVLLFARDPGGGGEVFELKRTPK